MNDKITEEKKDNKPIKSQNSLNNMLNEFKGTTEFSNQTITNYVNEVMKDVGITVSLSTITRLFNGETGANPEIIKYVLLMIRDKLPSILKKDEYKELTNIYSLDSPYSSPIIVKYELDESLVKLFELAYKDSEYIPPELKQIQTNIEEFYKNMLLESEKLYFHMSNNIYDITYEITLSSHLCTLFNKVYSTSLTSSLKCATLLNNYIIDMYKDLLNDYKTKFETYDSYNYPANDNINLLLKELNPSTSLKDSTKLKNYSTKVNLIKNKIYYKGNSNLQKIFDSCRNYYFGKDLLEEYKNKNSNRYYT